MSQSVISVENLSKRYLLGQNNSGDGLRHVLQEKVTAPFRWLGAQFSGRNGGQSDSVPKGSTEFWALKDISFEINRGDVVGIIGRNGAGKSTLLKVLSRITEPTRGRISIEGRVASLLEVGTGFHPDLTGRENIYLNGAILGMHRAEIKQKFDEIVDFAEVEEFLDTPVKRYSSGMYVRLAFAVAAHLDPEILIVDEVLAVGDVQFQRKCLGKMGQVASQSDRTVLFVSHNMSAIASLCPKSVYLKGGQLVSCEPTANAIARYSAASRLSSYERNGADRGPSVSWIRRAWIQSASGVPQEAGLVSIAPGSAFDVFVEICVRPNSSVELTASFHDAGRRPLWYFKNSLHGLPSLPVGEHVVVKLSYVLPRITSSELIVDMAIGVPNVYPYQDLIVDAITCPVINEGEAAFQNFSADFPLILEPKFEVVG